MEDFFAFLKDIQIEMNHWTWFVAAVVFLALEFAIPGVVFLWFGVAAVITGLVVLIGPGIGWEAQFILFGVLAFVAAYFGRRYVKMRPIKSENETLNRRSEQYIGRIFEVVTAIENGTGRVKVGDGIWTADGPDTAIGEKVKVIGVEGTNLKVEAMADAN